jgi:hypothetical protein
VTRTFLFIVGFLSTLAAILLLASASFGWLLARALPLATFEATLLSLVAIVAAVVIVGGGLLLTALTTAVHQNGKPESVLGDLSAVSFVMQDLAANTRCPCGSRKKYKNCHGKLKNDYLHSQSATRETNLASHSTNTPAP